MSSVNVASREIAVKIVFYGPGLSGKTTTLRKIYESVRPTNRGEMTSLATEGDRTLFFDFLPVKVERVGDCAVRLALYTVPGQVFYNATRKLVLQGADGVVFVVDSQPEAMTHNEESLRNLEENLEDMGIDAAKFPLVLQYNKRDLPRSLPVAELRKVLNRFDVPEVETAAATGHGVLDVLKTITRLVIKDLKNKKVVPQPRAPAEARGHFDELEPEEGGKGLEGQIHAHLSRGPTAGPVVVLAPPSAQEEAQAVDDAWLRGDVGGCIRAADAAVRKALMLTGEGSVAEQAFLVGVDGTDLLRLQRLVQRPVVRQQDAAFALYVTLQVFTRVAQSGLSQPGPQS